ncbi:hypothetical protein ACXHXM_27915
MDLENSMRMSHERLSAYVIGALLGAIFAIAVSIFFGLHRIFHLAVLALLPVLGAALVERFYYRGSRTRADVTIHRYMSGLGRSNVQSRKSLGETPAAYGPIRDAHGGRKRSPPIQVTILSQLLTRTIKVLRSPSAGQDLHR